MPCLKENRSKHKHNVITLNAKMYCMCWRSSQQHEAVTKMLCFYPFKIQQDDTLPVISSVLMSIDQWKVFTEITTTGFTNVT